MFVNQQKNKAGIHVIRLFIRGKPWVIAVDSFLLFKKVRISDIAIFASWSPEGSVWAPLLEKAWAKAMGNYLVAREGHKVNALNTILGVPTFVF